MTLPIVLLHGIRLSRTMWQPVQDRLHHPAHAIDLPGHGTRRGERFTLDAATQAVADAIDAAGGQALVAGLSMGGYVAIATAERFPERVAGLVAIGCTARNSAMNRAFRAAAGLAGRFPARRTSSAPSPSGTCCPPRPRRPSSTAGSPARPCLTWYTPSPRTTSSPPFGRTQARSG